MVFVQAYCAWVCAGGKLLARWPLLARVWAASLARSVRLYAADSRHLDTSVCYSYDMDTDTLVGLIFCAVLVLAALVWTRGRLAQQTEYARQQAAASGAIQASAEDVAGRAAAMHRLASQHDAQLRHRRANRAAREAERLQGIAAASADAEQSYQRAQAAANAARARARQVREASIAEQNAMYAAEWQAEQSRQRNQAAYQSSQAQCAARYADAQSSAWVYRVLPASASSGDSAPITLRFPAEPTRIQLADALHARLARGLAHMVCRVHGSAKPVLDGDEYLQARWAWPAASRGTVTSADTTKAQEDLAATWHTLLGTLGVPSRSALRMQRKQRSDAGSM